MPQHAYSPQKCTAHNHDNTDSTASTGAQAWYLTATEHTTCRCLQAAIKDYVSSDAHKKERRDIDKQLTKVTQQISGTRYVVSLTQK